MSRIVQPKYQRRTDPLDSLPKAFCALARLVCGLLWGLTALLAIVALYRFLVLPKETPPIVYIPLAFWFVVSAVLARCAEGIVKALQP